MQHAFRETWPGLKRNMTMTVTVIITTSVPLLLFGARLLTSMEVGLVENRWYGGVEISVFLCVERSMEGACKPGRTTTDAQRKAIERALRTNPEIEEVFYESREEAFKESQRVFKDSPVLTFRTVEQMQDSFCIKLLDPENCRGVVSETRGLRGIQDIRDLRSVLGPVLNTLGGLQWTATGISVLLLFTTTLQISITIQMAAFTRRCEIGITRLVRASSFYTLLSFLLESLVTSLIDAPVSSGSAAITYLLLIEQAVRPSVPAIVWTDVDYVFSAIIYITVINVALSAIPMLLATRRYLRV